MAVGSRFHGQDLVEWSHQGPEIVEIVEHLRLLGTPDREHREIPLRVVDELRRGAIEPAEGMLAQLLFNIETLVLSWRVT